MNLKPIVASLALLLGGQALAAYVPANPKMERLQAKLDRNQNPYYAQSDWFKRICVSGLVQVSAGWSDNTNSFRSIYYLPATTGGSMPISELTSAFITAHPGQLPSFRFLDHDDSSDLYLSRANLYIDADINEYVEAHLAWDFANAQVATHINALDDERLWGMSTLMHGQHFMPDEAYITIGNFAKSPLYFRAGREYLRYGHYERNVVPANMVQLMTQTHADAAEIGFVDVSGFNGAAYVFRSQARGLPVITGVGAAPQPLATNNVNALMPKREINNFGAQIGYVWQNGPMGLDLTADFLYDVSAVNMINFYLGAPNNSDRESGIHLSAMGHYEQFDAIAQFTTTLGSYPVSVMTYNLDGARPLAWLVGLGYTMSFMHNNDAHIGVNYQQTHEALGFNLPRYRIQGDLRWEVYKNTEIGLYLWYDKDYSVGNVSGLDIGPAGGAPAIVSPLSAMAGAPVGIFGTGNHNFSGVLSLSARFA